MDTKLPWKIADLIVARLNDSITEEETRVLEEWLRTSSRHRVLYEEWMRRERFEQFREKSMQHDYLPKYRELCHHIGREKRKSVKRYWGYAAAAVILLSLGWIMWGIPRSEEKLLAEQDHRILPGELKAVLTLPDGETLSLAHATGEQSLQDIPAILFKDTLTYAPSDPLTEEEYHLISIPRGGEYILKLADGTCVWLNAETELRYPAGFVGNERKVFLKGEAYFEVAHDTLRPFVVETDRQKLTVLGTSFAVRAYGDENCVLTTLETGKVKVVAGDRQVTLTPGYQSKLTADGLEMNKVNTTLYTAWHKGKFVFIDQPLEEILNTLARWYNIEVFYSNAGLQTIQFTGELRRYGDIRELLDKLEQLEKVRFNIKGRTVTVSTY